MSSSCPLCNSSSIKLGFKSSNRDFFRCINCDLVFVPSTYFLSPSDEKKRYSTHENGYENSGYRKYFETTLSKIESCGVSFDEKTVLDYGAGEEFVLTKMLLDRGVNSTAYDPLYGLTVDNNSKFDIIIASESIEHFVNPIVEFENMKSKLLSFGVLAFRTELTDSIKELSQWWYANDPTHISFFSSKTMEFVASFFGGTTLLCDKKNITVIKLDK
jgi:hypothetical protein